MLHRLYINPSFIRITCSLNAHAHLGLLDRFVNGIVILSAPPNICANTSTYVTNYLPCNRGINRDYYGIELCYLHSSSTNNCSKEFYCPHEVIGKVTYPAFESIEQDQEYPENILFGDILMQNIFTFNIKSVHCLLVSPITRIIHVMIVIYIIVIRMRLSEKLHSHLHYIRDRVKQIFRKIDRICMISGETFYMQDGAQVHYAQYVRHFLCETFSDQWIGRHGPIE
ncbi:hypothetical protein I4U23_017692 [Adineta vaga]|nr:hypothetical protein I4U23_017692 [Adineta vaga]